MKSLRRTRAALIGGIFNSSGDLFPVFGVASSTYLKKNSAILNSGVKTRKWGIQIHHAHCCTTLIENERGDIKPFDSDALYETLGVACLRVSVRVSKSCYAAGFTLRYPTVTQNSILLAVAGRKAHFGSWLP
ncbi:MAG: hypothetical protein KME50_37490 [Nostoc desertorum CM1-VF14]|nr:hypothetical protein [Nostoc desertorum CM1-VF14]